MTLQTNEVKVRVYGSALGAFPGAESVGVVVEAGSGAQELVGHAVVVPRLLPCGECPVCRRGVVSACPALAPRPLRPVLHEVLPARYLYPLSPPFEKTVPQTEDLWPYAVLSNALLTPYSALALSGASAGTVAVVVGHGFQAALAVSVAELWGLVPVRFSEKELLEMAPDGARQEVAAMAGRHSVSLSGAVVLETTGTDVGRALACSLAQPGSCLLFYPAPTKIEPAVEAPHLPPWSALLESLVTQQATLRAVAPLPDLLPELSALLSKSKAPWTDWTVAVSNGEQNLQEGDNRLPILRL